jgi:hypothetical protein
VLERFDGDYESDCDWQLDHASTRTLVVRHSFFGHYRNSKPGGKVFLEDVCGGDWDFTGQRVWMRQLNPEARGDSFNVRATDTKLWALGYKTEGPKTAITATGGQLEVLAAFLYANRGTDLSTTLVEGPAGFMRLNQVLCKACAHKAEDRYATATEMKAALEAVQEQFLASPAMRSMAPDAGSDSRANGRNAAPPP